MREEKNVKEWNKKWNEVRAKWRNKNIADNDWRLETPGDIRDGAMKDLKKALKSNLAIRKAKGGDHRFSFKFRSRKDASESIYLCKRNVRIIGDHAELYPRSNLGKLGPIKMTGISFFLMIIVYVSDKNLPKTIEQDLRLVRTRLNEYFLIIPCKTNHGQDDVGNSVLTK